MALGELAVTGDEVDDCGVDQIGVMVEGCYMETVRKVYDGGICPDGVGDVLSSFGWHDMVLIADHDQRGTPNRW